MDEFAGGLLQNWPQHDKTYKVSVTDGHCYAWIQIQMSGGYYEEGGSMMRCSYASCGPVDQLLSTWLWLHSSLMTSEYTKWTFSHIL